MMQNSNLPQSNVPLEVKARMWQFFLKTSVPRLIAKHEKQKANNDFRLSEQEQTRNF